MAQFALLFVGGTVPADKREKVNKDWQTWMGKLGQAGKVVSGSPFGVKGKVMKTGAPTKDYQWEKDSNVTGYCIVEAPSLAEAETLSRDCPQLFPEYGPGTIEIRDILPM